LGGLFHHAFDRQVRDLCNTGANGRLGQEIRILVHIGCANRKQNRGGCGGFAQKSSKRREGMNSALIC
jgi:hypothetical protein